MPTLIHYKQEVDNKTKSLIHQMCNICKHIPQPIHHKQKYNSNMQAIHVYIINRKLIIKLNPSYYRHITVERTGGHCYLWFLCDEKMHCENVIFNEFLVCILAPNLSLNSLDFSYGKTLLKIPYFKSCIWDFCIIIN